MKSITFLLILGLLSCGNKKEIPTDKESSAENKKETQLKTPKLSFNQPVQIDSSDYVMYPLDFNKDSEEGRVFSSKGYEPTTYWNIIFYNTKNGVYHLLDDKLKMVIHSYTSSENDNSPSDFNNLESGISQNKKSLYYSITTIDFNKDGKYNSADPNYLFMSDNTGRTFKQISPHNFNVDSWVLIKGTNKILMKITKDTNGDKKFNGDDETIPFIYDPNKNSLSEEIFPDSFKTELKNIYGKHWRE
jgi:hypothetical protein